MAKLGSDLERALLFQGLSDEEFAFLSRHIVHRAFKSGDNLLVSGHEAPGIFVIASGLVSAVVTDESGSEREVATLGQGECVGEIALMTGEPLFGHRKGDYGRRSAIARQGRFPGTDGALSRPLAKPWPHPQSETRAHQPADLPAVAHKRRLDYH